LGLSPCDLRRVVLTHDHVDHIYGLPHLLQAMAIAGAPAFLELRAPAQTLHTVDDMVRTFGLDGEHYPRLEMREIELRPGHAPLALDGTRLRVAPAAHSRETAALRFGTDEVSVCYSSDTRPSNDVNRLARGTDIFMHDCGGPHRRRAAFSSGHSSALEAASAASAAGAKRLVLMHLGSRTDDELQECLAEARNVFEGPVMLAEDGRTWNLPERSFISPESGRAAVR
jgi:ribonuclease Z